MSDQDVKLRAAFEAAVADLNSFCPDNGSLQCINRSILVELHEKVRRQMQHTSVPPQPPITYVQAQHVYIWILEERAWRSGIVMKVDDDNGLYEVQTPVQIVRVSFEMSGLLRPRATQN